MRLFDIASEYQNLMQQIMDCDELTPEQLQAIDEMQDSIENKAKATAAVIKNMEADYKAIQDAIQAMREREIRLEKKMESLKVYLKSNLERCDIKEVKSPWFDIKIKNNPPGVDIKDETLIPPQYIKEIVTHRFDRTTMLRELKNNIMIPGAILAQGTRLEIR